MWTQSSTPVVTQNQIYRATTNCGPNSLHTTMPAGTSNADTSVTAGVTYYYRVAAVNANWQES